MEYLRKPFFIVALVLILLVVLIELGSLGLLQGSLAPTTAMMSSMVSDIGDPDIASQYQDHANSLNDIANGGNKPPGQAVPAMALLDGQLLFTAGLMGISLLIGEQLTGRLQGVATLIFSIIIIIAGFFMVLAAIGLLLLMVSLLLAVPFGTLAYLAIYGFFNRGGASAALSLIMLLKVGFVVCLVLAHQRFIQNLGLVLLIITSLLANIITSFLQGLVPLFLVSITDAIAGIVVIVLALIWAILFLVFSVVAIIKALRISR